MSRFDEDTKIAHANGAYRAEVSEGWNVGPIPNGGGYLLAIALRAMSDAVPGRTLRTVTAHYLRPGKNTQATIEVEPVKIGRRMANLEAKMKQEGAENMRVLAAFAAEEESAQPALLTGAPLLLPAIEECMAAAPLPGITIGQRFDTRYTRETGGFLQGLRGGPPRIDAWMRFADGAEPSALSLPLFADALPPPIFNLAIFRWVPTLELTVHVRAKPVPGWLRVRFETRFAFGGHLEADGEIWDSSDTLVAQSRQLMLMPT